VNLRNIQDPPRALAVTTPDLGRSMVYLARTDSGVVAVDLGWVNAGPTVRSALRRIGSAPGEVTHVFLTHSHRDHIRGWKAVPGATYHLAAADLSTFAGGVGHRDISSRVAGWVFPGAYPGPDDSIRVLPFSRDTVFAFGADTVRAYLLPGHTPGSAAYLTRGILFVGDALAYSSLLGFRLAKTAFTHDPAQNRASLASLFDRVASERVEWVCTAHAKCARPDALRRKGLF